MTEAQVAQFKRACIIEELAKATYYSAIAYHAPKLDHWGLWVPGVRCADVVQHLRQQRFRDEATAEMIIATPELPAVSDTRHFVHGLHLVQPEVKP